MRIGAEAILSVDEVAKPLKYSAAGYAPEYIA
jgi:hypothetical protein